MSVRVRGGWSGSHLVLGTQFQMKWKAINLSKTTNITNLGIGKIKRKNQ